MSDSEKSALVGSLDHVFKRTFRSYYRDEKDDAEEDRIDAASQEIQAGIEELEVVVGTEVEASMSPQDDADSTEKAVEQEAASEGEKPEAEKETSCPSLLVLEEQEKVSSVSMDECTPPSSVISSTEADEGDDLIEAYERDLGSIQENRLDKVSRTRALDAALAYSKHQAKSGK